MQHRTCLRHGASCSCGVSSQTAAAGRSVNREALLMALATPVREGLFFRRVLRQRLHNRLDP